MEAIVNTIENVLKVKKWCAESGIDVEKVCDFYEFPKKWSKPP